jgi:transcriptional regulator CtsR
MKFNLFSSFGKRVVLVSALHFAVSMLSTQICVAENQPKNFPNNLVSFTADCNSYFAQIKWTTASESKKGYFIIERTKDGVHFETVTMMQNSVINVPITEAHEYSIKDESPLLGVSYYRISEIDSAEKKSIYINTIVYTPCENDETIDAVVDENQVTVSVNALTKDPNFCNISILNENNKAVLNHTKKISVGMNSYKVDANLNAGEYNLKVSYRNNKFFSKTFKIESAEK